MKSKLIAFAASVCLSIFSWQANAEDLIRIHGSNTLGDQMVPVLVESWMKKIGYKDIKKTAVKGAVKKISAERDGESLVVEIVGKGSSSGFQDLVNNETEIAMLSRPVNAKELDDGWQLGNLHSPDQEHVVALQAITPIVHPGNSVVSLTQGQLNQIVAGKITNWQQLGGQPGLIKLHLGKKMSGLGELQTAILASNVFSPKATLHANSKSIITAVAGDPLAIGIAEFSATSNGVRPLAIKVGSRVIRADKLNIISEDYPLTRRLYFYTGQLVTALGRSFLMYSVSDQGQRVLAKHSHLSLTPSLYVDTAKANHPKDYEEWISGASKLSFAFRFGDDFSIFDSRGEQDLSRLKDFMARPENKHRKVILIGHSEKQSSNYVATAVSIEYADLVASALIEAGIHPVRVRGIGQALPLSDTPSVNFYRNRRVEVWMQ